MLVAQGNLVQAVQAIQRQGGWVYGLEAGAQAVALHKVRLDGALGLVVGNEGEGMRKLVRQACDQLVQLPMRGAHRLAECGGRRLGGTVCGVGCPGERRS
jgi:23S rRNA (guanosine2251-2'-O)-methyltransferase